jgi:hypothetical protein
MRQWQRSGEMRYVGAMRLLTPHHDAILALFDWLPGGIEADAVLVANLLDVPETDAAQLLDELETAECITSATGPVQ